MSEDKKKYNIKDAWLAYQKDPVAGEKKLLACVESYKDQWLNHRSITWDRIWRNNVLFYSGKHYVRDVAINRASSYRVLLRENHTNNIIQRMISVFQQNMPITRAFSSSTDWDDVKNAESTEQYLKYFWRTNKIEKQLAKYLKYSTVMGNAFAFHQWNPDKGGKILIGEAESKSGDAEIAHYNGDIEVCIDDPLRINVRPGIDEIDDMYDIIRSVPASKSYLESVHGEITADTAIIQNVTTGDIREDDDAVIQHHYFHKPTPWFPEGLYVSWVSNKILKCISYPTGYGDKLPLVHLPFDKPPMTFWGVSTVEQIMDLQEQLNRAASMIIEARNLVARPRVFASHESMVSAQSISDRPGEIVKYKQAGGAPSFQIADFKFGEMQAHKSDVRNAMGQVSGMSMGSRGEIPAQARTALALQLVLEQDRSQFMPFIKAFHQCILDINYGILNVTAANIEPDDAREIKIEGKSNTTRLFHGGMIPSPLDLYLEDTNPLGWSSASRIESVLELVKAGLIPNPNKALEMLKLNSTDPAYEFINISRECQQREFDALNKGKFVDIGSEDDDEIHLEEITKVMASFEFKSRPEPVKMAYQDHCDQHKNRVQQSQQAMGGGMQSQKAPSTGGIDPDKMTQGQVAPLPGQGLESLLTSSRAG